MYVTSLCCVSSPPYRSAAMGYVDAQAGDAVRTAFRRAEKRYKHYKQRASSTRGFKHRDSVPPTDLSEVLDFRAIKNLFSSEELLKKGIKRLEGLDWPIFTMDSHPGFYFIPEALNTEQQMFWIKESLSSFPQPPNRTNHTAFYGQIVDLWSRAQNGEVLECPSERIDSQTLKMQGHKEESFSTTLLQRSLADAAHVDEACLHPRAGATDTCVYQCDFDKNSIRENCDRNRQSLIQTYSDSRPSFNQSGEHVDEHYFGQEASTAMKTVSMKDLLRKLRWATLGLQFDWSKRAYDLSLPYRKIPQELCELASKLAQPAMNGDRFQAEAAIVNYFGCDDMLGGHLDDMEADWSKPIVSISFGCKAIFLLGGTTRDQDPTAMFLRSGDVVLMAGPARQCFHGVPRIFADPNEADLPDFKACDASSATFLEYIKTSRINLNIRQVF